MLRPLRTPHLARRLLNLCLLLTLVLTVFPVSAGAVGLDAPRQQTQQQSVPQTLNFVNNVAQVQSTASLNQNQVYLFFGAQNQSVRIQLSSTPTGANFMLSGANNTVYKNLSDPTLDWSFTLPESQNYRITVNSAVPVVFTLVVTLGGQSSQAQRITFLPGQTNWQGTGTASPTQSPQYILTGAAGQILRVILFSSDGQANFSVRGVSDGQVYKQPTDPSRDWTITLPSNQDYLITVTSPTVSNFTLQVYLSGAQPGQPERINFAPGQSSAVVSGSLQPNVPKSYVFYAAGGRTIRLLLSSQPNGSANFSVIGASDGIIYKHATDAAREWSYPISVSQDYVVTVFSPVASSYTLEVTVPTAQPPTNTPGTPVPTIPPGCTTDTIQNGNFEVDGFWVFGDTPIQPAYNSVVTRTPLRSMRLGLDSALGTGMQNTKGFSSIRQPFQISAAATIAQLRWWNFYRTEEGQTDNPGLAEDKQQVVLLNPDLTTVAVLRSVRRNTNAWQEEMVDLTPYRGKPLLLYFNVYNDGNGLRTWQYLDDVFIYVCYPAMTATPVITPVPPLPLPPIVDPAAIVPLPSMAVLPTSASSNFVAPTPYLGTAVYPTGVPTAALTLAATIIAPVVGQITETAGSVVTSTLVVSGGIGGAALFTPSTANGEPQITILPPDQQGVQIAAATVEAQPTATFAPLQVSQPVQRAAALRVFERPLSEVLTWGGIMLGALAIIGILVALIWQASARRD